MTREVARDAAWAYAHVVALVMSCVNKAITRTHNDMKGETSMCVRGEPAESPGHLTVKKRFGNTGANCQTRSNTDHGRPWSTMGRPWSTIADVGLRLTVSTYISKPFLHG